METGFEFCKQILAAISAKFKRPIKIVGYKEIQTYLLEFMRAENGFDEIFSSIGLLTEGMGMLLMPLS